MSENDYYDLSGLDEDDLSSVYEELDQLSKETSSGVLSTVNSSGELVPLLSYSLEQDNLWFETTKAGEAIFRNSLGDKLEDGRYLLKDPSATHLAMVLGLPYKDNGYLENLVGDREATIVDILEAAKLGDSTYLIGDSIKQLENELSQNHLIESESIFASDGQLSMDQLTRQLSQSDQGNSARVKTTGYEKVGDQLIPKFLKGVSTSLTESQQLEESRQLAFEYAAVKAMGRKGIDVPEVMLEKDENNNNVLIMDRIDRESIPIMADVGDGSYIIEKNKLHAGSILMTSSEFEDLRSGNPVAQGSDSNVHAKMLMAANSMKLEGREKILSSAMFSSLIGNTDTHGDNMGFALDVKSTEAVNIAIAKQYDVEPFAMRTNSSPKDSSNYLAGKVLSELSLNDIKGSSYGFIAHSRKSSKLDFAFAKGIREEMIDILETELLTEDKLSKKCLAEFSSYLKTPLGSDFKKNAPDLMINEFNQIGGNINKEVLAKFSIDHDKTSKEKVKSVGGSNYEFDQCL